MNYFENLCKMMLKTRGARFNAASALDFKERFSIATMAFLSIYLMSLAVWQIAMPEVFDDKSTQIFGGISVVASVSLLVLALLDYAYGRAVKSEKLHQNALKVTQLVRELERELEKPSPNLPLMRKIAKQYEDEVAETQVNHSSTDYKKYVLQKTEAPNRPLQIVNDLKIRWLTFTDYAKSLWAHMSVVVLVIYLTVANFPSY